MARHCGRLFTDDHGCRWKLVSGPALDVHLKPDHLTGWVLVTVDGQHSFYTITGRLFIRISCPPQPPVVVPREVLPPPKK